MLPLPSSINLAFAGPTAGTSDNATVSMKDHNGLPSLTTNGNVVNVGNGSTACHDQKADSPMEPFDQGNFDSGEQATPHKAVNQPRETNTVEPAPVVARQIADPIFTSPDPTIVSRQLAHPIIQTEVHLPTSTRLRRMIMNDDKLVVCPGVFDGLSARIALSVGFDAMYMTGAGTTASRLGQPDLGIAQLYDMRGNAEMIANLDTTVPLIADMDTGFGGPIMIDRAVTEYARAGVAAFHIEDQILQKRCGHLAGKAVVSLEEFMTRIKAAKAAKEKAKSDIIIIGRTDALQKKGYDECIRRLRAARDAGADVGLLEGLTSKEMARQVVKDMAPMPLLLNMVEHGATPLITTKEAQEMGFRIMIFSFASLGPAFAAIRETFHRLKTEGVTGLPKEVNPKAIFEVCGLSEKMVIDEIAGGAMEKC